MSERISKAEQKSRFFPRCRQKYMYHDTVAIYIYIPYLFAYKPISAISRDPKLFYISSC